MGKQVYYWAHGWRQRESGAKGLVRRCYFRLAHRLLLYGRRSRGIALENGFDARRVHVIYNCLDYPAQRAARQRLGMAERQALRRDLFGSDDVPVVACPTRLVPQRRLDLLLEAVARLRATHQRRVQVLLVGDGPERAALEALAARLQVEVHFAGACYDEEHMAGYLTAATCTVAPGMVGLSAMHSLAFGVPVLTHGDPDRRMPESEAVVPGLTGDHFRTDDVDDLALVIERWTRTSFPAADVSTACIRAIERFYNPGTQLRTHRRGARRRAGARHRRRAPPGRRAGGCAMSGSALALAGARAAPRRPSGPCRMRVGRFPRATAPGSSGGLSG